MYPELTAIRVLHVDDDPEFAEMAADFLEQLDERFDVETASSASAGKERLASGSFDCVVSDYDMPSLNGIDFLESVRETHPDLPFVLFTGKGSEEVASDAISAGVTDYLQKEHGTSQYTLLANRVLNAVEQYRSRTALEESQKRLSLFVEQSPLGVLEYNQNFEIVGLNRAGEEILGYTEAELRGETWEILVTEESYDNVDDVTDALAEARGGFHSIDENVRGDGEHIIVEWHNRVVTDESGDVVAIFSLFQDITERQQREEELEVTRRRLEAILENTTTPMFMKDAEGRYVFVNRGHEDLFGFEEREVVGHTDHELFPETMADEVRANDRIVLDNGEPLEVEEHVVVDGEEHVFLSTKVPIHDTGERADPEEPVAIFGVAVDITERKARERELQRYESIVTTMREAACIYDTEGRFALVNQYLADFYGTTPEALVGEPSRLVPMVREQHGEAAYQALLDGERDELTGEVEGEFGEHGAEVLEYRFVPLEVDGDVEGIVGVAKEVTEFRARERTLERQNERLERFASVVSHDLRTPLNVVDGRLALAMDECNSEHLTAATNALERSQALIDDLLTLAREGDRVQHVETVDLPALVAACTDAVLMGDVDVSIQTERHVDADRSRLRQLLENLLRNAVDHGGSTITVGDLADGFYVADDGPGIPPEARERVFEAGYSTASNGTGFGLAIVREIADAHEWDVAVAESDAGGARIEVTGVE